MYYARIFLNGLPKMTNANNGHWRTRQAEAKKWKRLVFERIRAVLKEPPPMLTKATLTLTRHSASEPDMDGLVSGFKHVIDGLKAAGVIVDDKPSVIGSPTYLWKQAPRNAGFIEIEIKETV